LDVFLFLIARLVPRVARTNDSSKTSKGQILRLGTKQNIGIDKGPNKEGEKGKKKEDIYGSLP